MSGWRHHGLGRIDRTIPLSFTFDGQPLKGYQGDTIASALLAGGPRILGRSFKYHRPRGLWGMGNEEPNAIFDVTLNGQATPNVRATTMALIDGMALRSVNTTPSADQDRLSFLDRAQRFLPAGFYYKTFMIPGWMKWEPMIRRMAGLGRLDPRHHPPADVPAMNADCDVLVIGGGPAGLAAAASAADAGRAVWLVDESPELGGSLRWRGGRIDGMDWPNFAAVTRERVLSAGGRILTNTLLWGAFDHGLFAAWEQRTDRPDRHWRLRARSVILAAGAIERPLWFANNDLPGVMSAEAALHYLKLYGAVPGRRIVIACANDAPYAVAQALLDAGCTVTLVDARKVSPPAPEGVEHLRGAHIIRAHGHREVHGATIDGTTRDCDTILVSGGFSPSVHLHAQAGGKLDYRAEIDALVPRTGTTPFSIVGAANGTFGLAPALTEGHAAGGSTAPAPRADADDKQDVASTWTLTPLHPDPSAPGRIWLDPQNDVTLKDVRIAAQEGFRSVEHLKRYTTLGMATDQGRSANFAGLAAMAAITGQTIPETGTTTYRPPFAPVPLSVIGGMRRGAEFAPPKRLFLEDRHSTRGAHLREYGGWLRPAFHGTDENEARQHEARQARESVALYDASPLGKIEVIGPKAAELLDFCGYVRLSTLTPGRARYGFILSEMGIVHDDGVVLRLDLDRFIVSASSSHASSVRMMLEEARQDRFDPNEIFVHDVTSQWVTLAVTGPQARAVLKSAGIQGSEMTHMSVCETHWNHIPMRIARVSFTGDASWEISVPARHAHALYDALEGAREQHNGSWIGLEALMLLRAEKGYILVGKDTDGITMPQDLGWGGPREKRQDEYLGRRSLFTPEACRTDRRQLVGLRSDVVLPTGAHIITADGPRRSIGFITSSYFSPVLGHPIALAMIEAGHSLIGTEVTVFHLGKTTSARITTACALDPEGVRLDG